MKSLLLKIALGLAYAPFVVWSLLAIWFDGPSHGWLAAVAIGLLVAAIAAIFWRVRPFRRMAAAACAPVVVVMIWWFSISPRNDRDWQRDVARPATAEIAGNHVTLHNVRDFVYRTETDFDERWETREYDLDQLRGVDIFLSRWGPTQIAHTIMSWGFADGGHLAVSIETRKEKGETYSALLGFFRQYEIYYVVADERDVVGLRAARRGEHVSLFRLKQSPKIARALLEDYLREIDRLSKKAQWYNALTSNCTTTIRHHMQAIGAANRWNWRLLANGHLDEMGYERGMIDTSLPFEEMRRKSDVTERAKAAIDAADFSARIREGLPGAR